MRWRRGSWCPVLNLDHGRCAGLSPSWEPSTAGAPEQASNGGHTIPTVVRLLKLAWLQSGNLSERKRGSGGSAWSNVQKPDTQYRCVNRQLERRKGIQMQAKLHCRPARCASGAEGGFGWRCARRGGDQVTGLASLDLSRMRLTLSPAQRPSRQRTRQVHGIHTAKTSKPLSLGNGLGTP
jgi:hypothetical protein